ncbi:MAG: hypothetical protein ACREFP_09945, partial [Acetobacteraceae bacterium]
LALRRAQAAPRAAQPTLFELHEDHRPAGERDAAEPYGEPSLFAWCGRESQTGISTGTAEKEKPPATPSDTDHSLPFPRRSLAVRA